MTKSYISYVEHKGRIHVKEWRDGERGWHAYEHHPLLFVRSLEETGFKSLDKKFLTPLESRNIRGTRDFLRDMGDARKDIFGFWKYDVDFICRADYDDAEPSMFNVVYTDIETEVGEDFPNPIRAEMPVNMITLINRKKDMYAITTCSVRAEEIVEEFGKQGFNVRVIMCRSEVELFNKFLEVWEILDPDMIVGWNSEKFDTPYIVNRMSKILGEGSIKRLSPFGRVTVRDFIDDFGEDAQTVDIEGVSNVDMMNYYRKFVHGSQESYSLDNIAHVELKVGKLKHESGIPGHLLYLEYPTDGLRYNIVDVVRLMEIDMKKGVLDLAIIVAQMSKSNVEDTIMSTRLWMNMIYFDLMQKDIYFPIFKERVPFRKIVGGYVMDPISGLHEYIGSYDYASLYPSTMMGLNLGVDTKDIMIPGVTPDSLMEGIYPEIPEGLSMGANGQCYRTDEVSFINEIIQEKYAKRKTYKYAKLDYEGLEVIDDDNELEAELKRILEE